MAKYMPSDVPRSVTVIVNDPEASKCLDYIRRNIDAYGPHQPLLSVKGAWNFLTEPKELPGWLCQRVLKLLAVANAANEWMVRLGGPFFALHKRRCGTFLQAEHEALILLWLDRELPTEAKAEELLGPPAMAPIKKLPWWVRLLGR